MIVVNKQYIERFIIKKIRGDYYLLYQISKGVYLLFDENLEYIGINIYSKGDISYYLKLAESVIKELISKNILDIIEDNHE